MEFLYSAVRPITRLSALALPYRKIERVCFAGGLEFYVSLSSANAAKSVHLSPSARLLHSMTVFLLDNTLLRVAYIWMSLNRLFVGVHQRMSAN
jgi:hypothetical protein